LASVLRAGHLVTDPCEQLTMGSNTSCSRCTTTTANRGGGGQELVEKFPMWVMGLRHALSLTSLLPHEEQRKLGEIMLMQDDMLVSFVSHQWMGLKEPDLRMTQFREFQDVLQSLMDQSRTVMV